MRESGTDHGLSFLAVFERFDDDALSIVGDALAMAKRAPSTKLTTEHVWSALVAEDRRLGESMPPSPMDARRSEDSASAPDRLAKVIELDPEVEDAFALARSIAGTELVSPWDLGLAVVRVPRSTVRDRLGQLSETRVADTLAFLDRMRTARTKIHEDT